MKYSTVLVLLLAMCVVAMAGRAKKFKRKGSKCGKTFEYSECVNNTMTRTIASVQKDGCKSMSPKVKEIQCVYTKNLTKNGCTVQQEYNFTECGLPASSGRREKTVKITVSGDGQNCKAFTDTHTSDCDSKPKKGVGKAWKKQVGTKRGGRKEGEVCKYSRQPWSDCDPDTNMKTMNRKLKPGSSATCKPVHTIKRPCSKMKKKKKMSAECKYRRGEWSECDGTTNIKTMVKQLKRGNPNICEPTQTIEKICKRKHKGLKNNCKYRKMEKWGPCDPDTGLKSRQMTLKKGDPKVCAPKQTMTKQCKKKIKEKRVKNKGCKYEKSQWGPCDASTNTVKRTLNLKEGDPSKCNATKLQVKKCQNRHLRPHICKYKRTAWEECDPVTNMRVMIKTLKRGDPSQCEPTQTVERKCKGKKKTNVCKYKYEPWSACNVTTNTMTRQQVLKSGPESCQPVKEYSKKCKKPCKWQNGEWSECDSSTNQMTRVDTLRKSTDPSCPKTRVLSKKCGKVKKCMYDHGTWSECDNTENPVRTRTQKLVSGGPGCEPEKTTTKACTKQNGEVRCFFGQWQEYDACKNGVQKKRRQVIQGGLECERKSVKMKPC